MRKASKQQLETQDLLSTFSISFQRVQKHALFLAQGGMKW